MAIIFCDPSTELPAGLRPVIVIPACEEFGITFAAAEDINASRNLHRAEHGKDSIRDNLTRITDGMFLLQPVEPIFDTPYPNLRASFLAKSLAPHVLTPLFGSVIFCESVNALGDIIGFPGRVAYQLAALAKKRGWKMNNATAP